MVLSNTTVCRYNIIEESLQYMRRLRDETTETVQINTIVENKGVVLETVPSVHEVRIVVDPGARFGLHCSAPGKVLIAWLPEAEREKILSEMDFPRHSEQTITDVDEFRAELDRVRERQYATDLAEGIVPGLHCVSCPILDHNGYPVAALTVVAPSNRMPESSFGDVAAHVKRNAMMISKRIGYQVLETAERTEQ
jgi:DNA-binding IclR family transcriptional regulator